MPPVPVLYAAAGAAAVTAVMSLLDRRRPRHRCLVADPAARRREAFPTEGEPCDAP